ncbi:MAG: PfkB family carbohydrate kinase, partial [Lysobacter sp.]
RLHACCRQLLPHGSVVITLGAAGCFVSHTDAKLRGDSQPHYRLEAARVHALDTTGAGDAFNGALCASLAHAPDRAFVEHARFANRYAALSTERPGASAAMPLRGEVLARFGD